MSHQDKSKTISKDNKKMKLFLFLLFTLSFSRNLTFTPVSVHILYDFVKASIPNNGYQNAYEHSRKYMIFNGGGYDGDLVKENQIEDVMNDWRSRLKIPMPDAIRNQFRAIIYSQGTDFATFKIYDGGYNFYYTCYFGGASYDSNTDSVTMAIIYTTSTFYCHACTKDSDCWLHGCENPNPAQLEINKQFGQYMACIYATEGN